MRIARAIFIGILLLLTAGCQKNHEKPVVIEQADPEIQCATIEISPFSYVCLSSQGNFRDYQSAVDTFRAEASIQGFELADTLLAIFDHAPGEGTGPMNWDIGFVVPESLVVMEPLQVKKWNFNRVVQAKYQGPENKLETIYPLVSKFMRSHHLSPAGPIVERFPANHPSNVPTEFATEIWFAIKNE
ncbi:MAG: GyrI-like domain-containing protein [candidate division KSB1 bacterium]|nr:GyrI-like domain-containing protein [candidate division KSB1 bacterium]MDZ7401482.1 GyrI-like domain-containing protein [candidate division KSB1 bacterium]